MYSSNHSTLFYLILARTLGGQNSYRGKSVSLGRFMSAREVRWADFTAYFLDFNIDMYGKIHGYIGLDIDI